MPRCTRMRPALARHVASLCAGLSIAVMFGSPGRASDIIVNRLHCNDLCQSWLSMKHPGPPTTETSIDLDESRIPGPPTRRPPARDTAVRSRDAASPSAANPPDVPASNDPAARITDDAFMAARPPDPGTLVAVRGVVMVESDADRAYNRKLRDHLTRLVTPPGGVPPNRSLFGAGDGQR